jgi:LCP family protein required for cell wall assembly
MSDEQPPDPFTGIPDQGANPVEWDPVQRRFVERGAPAPSPDPPPAVKGVSAPAGPDPRTFKVPAKAVGVELPPQPGSPPASAAAGVPRPVVVPDPKAPAPPAAAPPTSAVAALPAARLTASGKSAKPEKLRRDGKNRRFLPHRPKLRRVIMLLPILIPLLVVALIAGGLLYANAKFNQLHRVAVGSALSTGGSGTNILLVGSDSRDVAGAAAIDGKPVEPIPIGERSDTMMVLRLDGSGAHVLSVPRDLIVTIAGTGKRDRVNTAYNQDLGGGPVRLIETVKAALGIPIQRYMEVDFATFAGVVDAIGGITINFPHPATDTVTGLDVKTAGPTKLDGKQALAYVRSRHYTELINGRRVEDPTADLGRIMRQQTFLTAVFGKVGKSRNPLTLLKVSGQVVDGLRVDDKLGFFDAVRLGWDLKGLNPAPVALPVVVNSDNATLHLVQPDAEKALAAFK